MGNGPGSVSTSHDQYVDAPRRQFVDEAHTGATRGAQSNPQSRPSRGPDQPADNAQRSAQGRTSPGHTGTPGVLVVHEGNVGNTARVRVTLGETVSGIDHTKATVVVSDLIGLEYLDQSAGGPARVQRSHWLQFVWREIRCTTQRRTFNAVGASVIASSQVQVPLTTNAANPQWSVDTLPPAGIGATRALIPWYDYSSQAGTIVVGGGISMRTPASLKIFDAPGPPTGGAAPIIESILREEPNRAQLGRQESVATAVLAFHFDTYLVQGFSVLYHVPWTATFLVTGLDRPNAVRESPRAYRVGSSGPISRLPRILYSALINEYPAYSRIAHADR